MTTRLTAEQQDAVDTAALMLVTIPHHRRANLITQIGVAYEDACLREWPNMPHERVIEHSRNFTVAILRRVREIDLASGGATVGNA
jgi:hypothetical protein